MQFRHRSLLNVLLMTCLVACVANPSWGAVLAQHLGSNDPEGALLEEIGNWDFTDGANLGVAPGSTPAWQISNSDAGVSYYSTSGMASTDLDQGWLLTAEIRVDEIADPGNDLSVRLDVPGEGLYWMVFGKNSQGNAMVNLVGAGGSTPFSHTVTTAGNGDTAPDGVGDGFHLFELMDVDGNGSADLYVDGEKVTTTPYVGFASSSAATTFFGDIAGTPGADASFAEVSVKSGDDATLRVIPEPASMAMLATGLLLVLPRRKRA